MKVFVIGGGGGGSHLVGPLCMLIGKENVIVMDGDTIEEKNLNRQLFTREDIGRNKSDALAERYGCEALPEWFAFGARSYEKGSWFIGCVDNMPGRAAILETCDFEDCCAVIAGNETYSADAYVYFPRWKNTPLDPRVYFTEILSDTSGDPRRAGIGCTGEAQEKTPQLVVANLLGAALAIRLFEIWTGIAMKMKNQWEKLPYRLVANHTRLETHLIESVVPNLEFPRGYQVVNQTT